MGTPWVLAITSPSLVGATGKLFLLGAGQAGLLVRGVGGEPELRSIEVCGLVVVFRRQGEAAEGTGWVDAAGCVRRHGQAAAPESPRDGRSGENASEMLGANVSYKSIYFNWKFSNFFPKYFCCLAKTRV